MRAKTEDRFIHIKSKSRKKPKQIEKFKCL